MMKLLVALCALYTGAALAPVGAKAGVAVSRRVAFQSTGLMIGTVATAAFADEEAPAVPAPPAEFPTDWGLSQDYYTDAAKVVTHMRLATSLDKGSPIIEKVALNTKKEMGDFVAFYRRFQNVSGKQSYSTLYTAINVLAGHYTSYGPKFPVPEKRRKRLYQEYAEIEKNIKKRR